jgi:acetyltransferase-like isoleucine patch superfamily enzyme
MSEPLFHPILPGAALPGDWYPGVVPVNISVGVHSMVDSSFCFKQFFSTRSPGLVIGENVTIWRASLAAEEQGLIEIGDYCYIANAALVCSERISIGRGVFIAGGVTIADSDFHPVQPAARLADTIALSPRGNRRNRPPIIARPVRIGDDVWIGYNAAILKGVTVGDGATIEPGAVVVEDVPPGARVAGNPAKIIDDTPCGKI